MGQPSQTCCLKLDTFGHSAPTQAELVLVLSLPAHPHAVKAAFPGFQLPTIPASSKRQPISRMLNRKNRLWFIAEHLIRNGGVLDGFDVEGSRLVCSNDATGAARAALFDLLISAKQYRWGYGKTERLGGLEVHGHLKFCRKLHRKITRLLAPQNAIHIRRVAMIVTFGDIPSARAAKRRQHPSPLSS